MGQLLASSLFLRLVLLCQIFVAFAAPGSIVQETCARCSKIDPGFDASYCVNVLNSNPGSCGADLSGLAVISLKIAVEKAESAQSTIRRLMTSVADSEKSRLRDCSELYEDAASQLADSVPAIKTGRISDARTWISAALDAAATCNDGFQEKSLSCPLKKENNEYSNIVVIALDIAALLDNN